MNSFRCRAQGFFSVFIPVMILIAIINGSVFAQWLRTAPNIYPATITDKVGIGTTTPSDVLDVRMPSTVNQAGLSVCGQGEKRHADYFARFGYIQKYK
jgi:hypothetical protein